MVITIRHIYSPLSNCDTYWPWITFNKNLRLYSWDSAATVPNGSYQYLAARLQIREDSTQDGSPEVLYVMWSKYGIQYAKDHMVTASFVVSMTIGCSWVV